MTAPTTSRAGSTVFHAFVGTGIALSLLLAVQEAGDKPPVEVTDTFEEVRYNEAWVVEAEVHNRSPEARCAEIRVAARDTETRDLAVAVAQPVAGETHLAPGATVRYRAVITDLSDEEYEEELEEFSAFVYDAPICATDPTSEGATP